MLAEIQVPIDVFMWFAGGCICLIFTLFAWLISYVISQFKEKSAEMDARISKTENKINSINSECENRHHRTKDHITNTVKELITKAENNHSEFVDLVRNTTAKFDSLVKELAVKVAIIETKQNIE